jgi:uncharacterized protein YqhQ
MSAKNPYTSIGGQAVIEGVMMRSPHFVAVAVRKPNRRIIIRNLPYSSVTQRYPFFRKPVIRGVVVLLESMFQGIDALSYSANVAAEGEEEGEALSNWAIAGSIAMAFVLGMGLFVALPHFLTALLASGRGAAMAPNSPLFHLVDGVLKMGILLAYVYGIALMRDIHRVFQYHGAEHKSIYAFEAGEELTIENARRHPRLHPRCGTSFLLFLVLISIAVFSVLFPLLRLTDFSSNTVLNHTAMILVKIALMLPVAGLAYEFIKACAFRMGNPVFRMLTWPGMVLQNLTTREPTDDQLEVALASLRQVLRREKGVPSPGRQAVGDLSAVSDSAAAAARTASISDPEYGDEFEIGQLSELGRVQADVAEFPEM